MATRTQTHGADGPRSRVLAAISDSVLVKVALLGVLLVGVGIGLELAIQAGFLVRGLSAVWAVVLLLWGTALVVAGIAGRTFIWWRRR